MVKAHFLAGDHLADQGDPRKLQFPQYSRSRIPNHQYLPPLPPARPGSWPSPALLRSGDSRIHRSLERRPPGRGCTVTSSCPSPCPRFSTSEPVLFIASTNIAQKSQSWKDRSSVDQKPFCFGLGTGTEPVHPSEPVNPAPRIRSPGPGIAPCCLARLLCREVLSERCACLCLRRAGPLLPHFRSWTASTATTPIQQETAFVIAPEARVSSLATHHVLIEVSVPRQVAHHEKAGVAHRSGGWSGATVLPAFLDGRPARRSGRDTGQETDNGCAGWVVALHRVVWGLRRL